jgi:hypothetical protein
VVMNQTATATAPAKTNAGVPFDFAQGRLLHCAMDDNAVHRFGRDDAFMGAKAF